jgi:D-hexose-6-phosphate mutarotase
MRLQTSVDIHENTSIELDYNNDPDTEQTVKMALHKYWDGEDTHFDCKLSENQLDELISSLQHIKRLFPTN